MAPGLLDDADRLYRGELRPGERFPYGHWGELAEPTPGVAFVAAFANVAACDTDDGLVLVDTSSQFLCDAVHDVVTHWRDRRVDTVVFTHGHVDHCFGVDLYEADAVDRGWAPPRVVAHEAITERFRRYVETAGYNTVINHRQFGRFAAAWPTDYRYPDETYRDHLDLDVGGVRFELHHARGETDDHTWVWIPQHRTLCTGDLFIWASPNCGNPQKVQRYAKEWAAALRTMAALDAEILLPGHGLPILGRDRIGRALTESARLLEHLHDETVAMMNAGATLDEIIHTVKAPPELIERPYLLPVYDEPEFVVRNVWRLYGGWYDGNPAHLKPAPEAVLARELAALAGGAGALARRAQEVAASGDLRLATHLAQWAGAAAPDDPAIHEVRAEVYEQRVRAESSLMAHGVFRAAARDSQAITGEATERP